MLLQTTCLRSKEVSQVIKLISWRIIAFQVGVSGNYQYAALANVGNDFVSFILFNN